VSAPDIRTGPLAGEETAGEAGSMAWSPEVETALRRTLLALADSKRLLGIRYSDWLLGAPSLEMGIAASSMAQDEWGHARLLYAMLKDVGLDPVVVEHQRSDGEYCSMDCLDHPFPDWAAFAVAVVLVDGALALALEALEEGSYAPARGRIGKMLEEEAFHRDLGAAWFRRIAGGNEEGRGALREAVDRMLLPALGCLAPDDRAWKALVTAGILPEAATLRSRYAASVGPLLALVGVSLPSEVPLPAGWDPLRGRGTGHPEAESLERARGDRNRMLFVE
jgi:ring-1,2-phenylacetyl-CoA epoxidase subunit PaaC